ncbi:hypothetical protein [Agromyces sp. SYSU T0242]|uniref:hypothetical protein n=1 Tax=Agromyces litoreus TaxID=3158561 RepID=UPI00339479AB
MQKSVRETLAVVSVLALLTARGFLLWIVVPVGFVAWLLVGWAFGTGPGQFLGWLDLNLIAALQRVLIRRVDGEWPMPRVSFVPIGMLRSVRHRVHLVYDPV